uniref:Uncharacterized protein n=1 Tax=Anopheles maculatus TaxID=74869 RepID=A0A182SE68_9DIPT
MGSLPNLSDLSTEKLERRLEERERILARERIIERDFGREKESIRTLERPIAAAKSIFQQKCPPGSRKVMRTRSSGQAHHIWDDPIIDQYLTNYSPASNRSHRISVGATFTTAYQFQSSSLGNRHRRDSVNSSIGATSVRKLLTVQNRSYGCRHKIPSHVRSKMMKNFILIAVAHGFMCTALVPLIVLQGANSTWFQQESWLAAGPDVGSGLLSLCCAVTA